MIKSYVVQLQTRANALKDLLGDVSSFEEDSKKCKDKLQEIMTKLSTNKDLYRKYQKINGFIDKHTDVLDCTYTADKVNIVLDQIDTLNEIAANLNEIQKMLPCLETDAYTQNMNKFDNIDILATSSQVKVGMNKLQVLEYDPSSLISLQEQEQRQMNAIMELNYRMVNNLNQKLKLAYQNKMAKK